MNQIHWNPEMFSRFVRAVRTAKDSHQMEFAFEGHIFVVAYADHLIDYLSDAYASSLDLQ